MTGRPAPRVPSWVVDAALAIGFVMVGQIELHHKVDDGFQAGPLWLNVPLVLLMTGPLAFRRRAPFPALAVMLAAAALPGPFQAHTIFFWGSLVPMALATYSLARHGDGVAARFAWLAGPVVLFPNMVHVVELRTPSNIFFGLGLFGVAWLVGRVLRRVSDQSRELGDALARLADQQAEREEAAAASERRRIAAEMHDVVAHAVSLMTLQAGAARVRLERDGSLVPEQLRAAEQTGRRALGEMRRALEVMRDPARGGAGPDDLRPLPGLDEVPALVREFREAGLTIGLEEGGAGEIPASVQLAAYRILQEALTNVLKHAGPVVVEASVLTHADRLCVRVANRPGRRSSLPTGGHGLTGMRERVAMFGGELRVGPCPDGGFLVEASVPLGADAAPTEQGLTVGR